MKTFNLLLNYARFQTMGLIMDTRMESGYPTIIDLLDDSIHIVDADLRIILVNKRLKKQLKELNLETDVIGRSLSKAFPFLKASVIEEYHRVLNSGKPLVTEEQTKIKDNEFFSEVQKLPIVDHNGEVHQIITVVHNITKRKRMEEALRKEKERYQMLVEKLHEGVLLEDENGIIAFINPRGAEMLGYTEEELIGKQVQVTIPSEEMETINAEVVKRNHGISSSYESTLLKKDGTSLPISISATPLLDETGTRQGTLSVFTDITEQKKMAEALRKSNETAQGLLNASLDTEMLVDPNGLTLAINEAAAQSIGKNVAELVGTCIYDHFPTKVGNARKVQSDEVVRSGKPLRYEDEREGRIYDNSVYPIFDAQGKVEQLAIFARDITDYKKAEKELRKHQNNLETLLNELARSNTELEQFASVVSHDLKAPLRNVNFLASAIIRKYEDKLEADGKAMLHLLIDRVGWMNKLIDGILRYSRAGRIKEAKVEVHLNELLPGIIELLNPPGHIHVTIETELPAISCEITRVTQVFQNLLDNAIKYMDKAEGQIKIACEDTGDSWKFSVTDNGSGIKEENLVRIFEAFQTYTTKNGRENIGIGLSVVKKIVSLYGGEVWVESKLSKGSTFYFTFPK